MQWDSEMPARDGFYWYKNSKDWTPTIIEIVGAEVSFMWDTWPITLVASREGSMWAGPLQPPSQE